MNRQQAYNEYLRNKVMTASPGELTLMLYEGAIRFINVAIRAIEEKDLEKAHNNIRRADDIIVELQSTLNHKYAVAKDFDNIYRYVKRRLAEANMAKDPRILEEVAGHIRSTRDAWKEVMRITGGHKGASTIDTGA